MERHFHPGWHRGVRSIVPTQGQQESVSGIRKYFESKYQQLIIRRLLFTISASQTEVQCTVYQSEILCTSCITYLQQQLSLSLSQAETHSQQPVCPSLPGRNAFTTASLSLSPRPKCIHNSQSVPLSQAEMHSQQPVCPSPRLTLSLYLAFTTASMSLSPRPKCIHNSQSVPLSQAKMHSTASLSLSPRPKCIHNSQYVPLPGRHSACI